MRRTLLATLALLAVSAPALAQEARQFVGTWGFVSYWNASDREKSIVGARGACGQPYAIAAGPNGGVMLHAADASAPTEMRLHAHEGKTYLVPMAGPEGGTLANRELVFADGNTFITRYVNEQAHGRYGMMVYARCGGRRR
jgi:hypothetical protein